MVYFNYNNSKRPIIKIKILKYRNVYFDHFLKIFLFIYAIQPTIHNCLITSCSMCVLIYSTNVKLSGSSSEINWKRLSPESDSVNRWDTIIGLSHCLVDCFLHRQSCFPIIKAQSFSLLFNFQFPNNFWSLSTNACDCEKFTL